MNMQELATCAQEGIAIKVFIMNNGYLGMVRQWQELFWDKRYSQVDMGQWPDFVKLAEAYGATGIRLRGQAHARRRHEAGARHRRPGARRRPRDARGEHLSDDPRRPARAEHGGLSDGRARHQGGPVARRARGRGRPAHAAASTCSRSSVENKPGVLTRIAGLFARRGFNIDTLAVGPTDDERISRITLTLDGALHPIDQVTKQLHKLVNVLKIRDLEPRETLARELALFKVSADGASRAEVMQICEIFRGEGGRRDQALDRRRADRDLRQGRRVRAARPAVRADRDGADRRDRDRTGTSRDLAPATPAAEAVPGSRPSSATGLSPASGWLDADSARRLERRLDAALRRARATGTPELASVTSRVDSGRRPDRGRDRLAAPR